MKRLLGLILMILTFASCEKTASLPNDERILDPTASAKIDGKLTRVYPVEFFLTSFVTNGIAGSWYMNKQTPWNSPNPNTQVWFQGLQLKPFYDSTVLYVSHYNPVDNGSGGIAYFEDGQIDIHLTKTTETSANVNGQVVTTQTGTWVLGPKDRIYGIFGEIYHIGSGNYTYTYSPKTPTLFDPNGIPLDTLTRDIYLKGKLR